MISEDQRPPSLFSCCFRCYDGSDGDNPRFLRRSSAWLRTRAHELPQLKDKRTNLFSKTGREGACRTRHAGDFRYDPLSYSLNFDDDVPSDGESRLHDFSARFVLTPLPAKPRRAEEGPARPVLSSPGIPRL